MQTGNYLNRVMAFSKLIYISLILSVTNTRMKILRENCEHFGDFNVVLENLFDSGSALKRISGKSKRQCLLACTSYFPCKSVNYKIDGGLCDLLDRNLTASAGVLQQNVGWIYITTDEYSLEIGNKCVELSPCQNNGKCVDTCDASGFECICKDGYIGTYCEKEQEYSSCQAAYHAGLRKDGVYYLTNAGYHYCVLSNSLHCSTGGYTLVMRTNGNLSTFNYESSHWTSDTVYNDVFALREGLHGQEAKFQGYNKLPFVRVCIGMKVGGTMNYVELGHISTSLLDYIGTGAYHASAQRRRRWLNLVPGGGLQNNCNKEGFNSVINSLTAAYVRIGILGNEQTDCNSPDTAIGIGIGGSRLSSSGITTGSTHNRVAGKGYIFIR